MRQCVHLEKLHFLFTFKSTFKGEKGKIKGNKWSKVEKVNWKWKSKKVRFRIAQTFKVLKKYFLATFPLLFRYFLLFRFFSATSLLFCYFSTTYLLFHYFVATYLLFYYFLTTYLLFCYFLTTYLLFATFPSLSGYFLTIFEKYTKSEKVYEKWK